MSVKKPDSFHPGKGPATGARWLAGFFLPYKLAICASFFIGISALLGSLPQPFLVMRIVDHSIPTADMRSLGKTVFQILALGFLGNLITWLESYFFAAIEKRIKVDILSRMYRQLLLKDSAFFSLHHSGKLLSRLLVDIGNLAPMMPSSLSRLIRNFLTAGVILYFLFGIHFGMALTVVALMPLLVLLYHFVGKRLFRAGARLRSGQDQLASLFQEDLRGIAITQSFGAEDFKLGIARKVMDDFQEAQRSMNVRESFSTALFFVISIASTLLLWGFGGYTAIHGGLSLGQLLAFGSYVGMLTGPVGNLLNSNFGITSALVSLDRLLEICGPETLPSSAPFKRAVPEKVDRIVLRDIVFAYPGGRPIFQGLKAEFTSGSISALTGANGTGKSTLLHLIQKIQSPDSGGIFFDDVDMADLDPAGLRKSVALVQQEPFLFNTSIRDNLLLGRPGIPNSRLMEICELAGVDDLLRSLPGGLEFHVSENGKNLSGGQRQRLHLVRALLGKPSVLLLDEFTSSLDPESEQRSHRGLRELFQGKIVLLVTHNALTLRLATRVCHLEASGGMVAFDLPDSDFEKREAIARMFAEAGPAADRQAVLIRGQSLAARVLSTHSA